MYHLYPSTLDPIAACQFCSRLLKRSLTFKHFGNLWVSKKWCFDILQSRSITRQRNHCVFYAFFFQFFFFLQDIIDTGATMQKLLTTLQKFEPATVKVAR